MCEIICVKKHQHSPGLLQFGVVFFHAKEAGGEVGEVFLPLSR